MTSRYIKFNLDHLENYYYLYYLEKYHKKCLDTLIHKSSTNENTCSAAVEDNILVDNLDIKYTKKYLDSKYKSNLISKIYTFDKMEKIKKEHNKYLKS